MMQKENAVCNDKNCPKHGTLIPRGRTFTGVVVSVNPHKTAVIEWEWWSAVPKYERYAKKRTRVSAHNPECINAAKGDKVTIKECRPLSKTKKFVITEVTGKEVLFAERERLLEEGKTKSRQEIKAEKEDAEGKKQNKKQQEVNEDA